MWRQPFSNIPLFFLSFFGLVQQERNYYRYLLHKSLLRNHKKRVESIFLCSLSHSLSLTICSIFRRAKRRDRAKETRRTVATPSASSSSSRLTSPYKCHYRSNMVFFFFHSLCNVCVAKCWCRYTRIMRTI